MNKTLLQAQKIKLQGQEEVSHNLKDMFFQQKDFRSLDNLKYQLLDALVILCEKKYDSNIWQGFAEGYKQHITSLATFYQDITQLLQQYSHLHISHKHHTSQAILLALLLCKQTDKKTSIVMSKKRMERNCQVFENRKEVDTSFFVQNCLQKQGIQVVDIHSKEVDGLKVGDDNLLIIDLFGLEPPQYYLPFHKNIAEWKKAGNVVIYCSQLQSPQIDTLLHKVQAKGELLQTLQVQLSPPHPVQTNSYEEQHQLLDQISSFLNSTAPYAQKQDILLFHPLDQPLHKYLRTLKQHLVKAGHKDAINIITDRNQNIVQGKTTIFVASSNQQLKAWNYSYSRVLLVIDYGFEEHFMFDYDFGCWCQIVGRQSQREQLGRMGWLGADRCGLYHYLQHDPVPEINFFSYYKEISSFIVHSLFTGQTELIDFQHPRVNKCLNYLLNLGIVSKEQTSYTVVDKRYAQNIVNGFSPIQSKMVLSVLEDPSLTQKDRLKYLNLVSMALIVLQNPGNLRKVKSQFQGSHIKPYAVWRKTGYLQSCLQILTKCQLIQLRKNPHNSKSQQFRRKTSKTFEGKQQDLLSKYHIKRKKNFQDMDVGDLIIQYTVNQQLLHTLRDKLDDFRANFEFDVTPILIDKQSFHNTVQIILRNTVQTGTALYTGSKSTQYFNSQSNISLNQGCLFSILNQRPELLLLLRLSVREGERKILMANSIPEQLYLKVYRGVPHFERPTKTHPKNLQSEQMMQKAAPEVTKQFSFTNIASAIFQQLLKNNGQTIQDFQYQNNCHLILHMDLGTISIRCFKDQIQNKNYVYQNLSIILKKLNQSCKYYTKKLHYMGIVNMIIGDGGKVLQIIDSDQISRCLVQNLPPQIAKEYVEVILQDFTVKKIEMVETDQYEACPKAVVQFYTRKAFKDFQQHYRRNMQQQNFFKMTPLKDSQYNRLTKQEQGVKLGSISTTLLFRWFTWKSHRQAQVKFTSSSSVKTTIQAFQANPLLDGCPVKLQVDSKDPTTINISNLKQHTDQLYITEALKDYGQIKSVQILKTPLKESKGDDQHIGHLLKVGANKEQIVKYKIISKEQKELGLRIARVAIHDNHLINIISQRLNKTVGYFGQGRLYVQPLFERQILIPQGCIEIYTQLFEELMEDMPKEREKIRNQIKQDQENETLSLVLASSIEQTLLFVVSKFKEKLKGITIDFPLQARNVIMNDIGVANLIDLEDKYSCKFVVSTYSSKIKVLASKKTIESVQAEVRERLNNHFFYRITLTSKIYKYYQQQPELLQKMQKQLQLILAQLQEDNFALLLQGSAVSVQAALSWLHQKDKARLFQKELNINDCGICGMPLQQSYRLFCQHRFCRQCIIQYLHYGFSDMSQFPFKCPDITCLKPIPCVDLEHLLDFSDWYKMRTFTANQFLKKNDQFDYCMTAGCQQINRIRQSNLGGVRAEYLRCDICKNSYCLQCNGSYHPARTCKQAQMSEDQLLKNYIKDSGVRKCVGKRCKALVVRYTGCYKVQCTRCGTCMCFKCKPEEMQAFATSQECYDHLSNKHGGFF